MVNSATEKERYRVIEILKKSQSNLDIEMAHSDAGDALCDLLVHLGFTDVVEEWKRVDKWYA